MVTYLQTMLADNKKVRQLKRSFW